MVHILDIGPAQAAALERAGQAEVDDAMLTSPIDQGKVLDAVREAAGDSFDELADNAGQRLLDPPWLVLVRGLPVAAATPILVAVSAQLGELVEPYRQPWSRVVRHIVPSRDRVVDGHVLNEFLHTDGTDWVQPNDYTCLFCVRPDQSRHGVSRLLDAETLLEELSAGPAAQIVDRLASEAVPWRVADELGGGVHREPPLRLHPPRIRWLRHSITLAHDDGLAVVEEEMLGDLARFEQLVERCRETATLRLQAGDLLLIDNARTLHARAAIADPSRSARELLRTKVMRREVAR